MVSIKGISKILAWNYHWTSGLDFVVSSSAISVLGVCSERWPEEASSSKGPKSTVLPASTAAHKLLRFQPDATLKVGCRV